MNTSSNILSTKPKVNPIFICNQYKYLSSYIYEFAFSEFYPLSAYELNQMPQLQQTATK